MAMTVSAAPPARPPQPEAEPWQPPENAKRANTLMDELLERAQRGRALFEREWFRNCLFGAGHHWIIFDRAGGRWRSKVKGKNSKWLPTPVTNRCSEHIDDNVSALTRTPPELSWLPSDDDPKSIAAADVADRIDELIVEETGRFRNARSKAAWSVTTGDVFVESGIDKSWEHGSVFVPQQECADCGAIGSNKEMQDGCPHCGGGNIMEAKERIGMTCPACGEFPYDEQLVFGDCPLCAEQAAQMQAAGANVVDMATGLPAEQSEPFPVPKLRPMYGEQSIGTTEPKGKLWERARSPFEVWYDLRTVREFNREGGLRWGIIREMVDPDEVKDTYPGMPLEEESTAQGTGGSVSLQYLESVSLLAGMIDPQANNLTATGNASGQGGRVLREVLYHLPTKDFPEGLTAIRINSSKMAEVKGLSYHDNDGQPFIPLVHIPFKKQPGRVPGRTFMADIVPINKIRNETECMMIVSERRMANPVNLIPDQTMKRLPTGEPGENWIYTHLSAGSGRAPMPTRLPGVEPSLYFERRLQGLDQQMERLAGSFAISHGEAPRGITAASALALLGERQERAVSPQIQAWEQGHEAVARQQMYIFREYVTEERTKALRDSLSKWSFESFSNADVGGNFTVKVEIGSATPKSSAQMRATLEAEMRVPGFLNLMDPGVQRRIHQIMGTTTVIQHMDADTKDAQQQQDLWIRQYTGEDGAEPMQFRPLIDNHMVHAAEHVKFAKGDKFREIEKKAMAGDSQSAVLIAEFYQDLQGHLEAIAPPPEVGPPSKEGPGAGRPEGTGKVLSAGRQDVPPAERAIAEPGTGMGGEGLR